MTSKHTPGPWSYIGDDETGGIKFAEVAAGEIGTRAHRSVAWCIGVDERRLDAATKANARLIAAAPDLLEALQEIVSQDIAELALDPDWPRRIARAAIAKATGATND